MTPKASVVIIAYNEEKYIEKTLKSLKNQTFKDFEIIVVDNNCTDKTAAIAKKMGAKVVVEKVQGMTPARETGFGHAAAPIIIKLDADSIIKPDWIKIAVKFFKKEKSAVGLRGSFRLETKSKLKNVFFQKVTQPSYYKLSKLLIGHHILTGPVYAIRKSAWEKTTVHRNDKLLHEDIDLTYHLSEFGKIHHHPKLWANWSTRRWTEKSLSEILKDYYVYPKRYFQSILIHH